MTPEESPALGALREKFALLLPRAYSLTQEERSELQERVCAFVDERKQAGLSPEHIVIELRRAGVSAGGGGFSDRLLEEAVQWCIRRYFHAN